MKSKKLLIFVTVMLFVLSSLYGCATPAAEPAQTDAQAQTDATAAPAAPAEDQTSTDVVEIHLANWRVEEIDAFKAINEEFMKEYPNIRPVYDAIKAQEYDSKMSIDLSGGAGADLIYVRPFDRGYDLYKAGYIDALTQDMVPNLANTSDLQKSIYTETSTGTIFAMPFIYINYGFIYNKTLFDKLGIQEPETWDDFFAACDKIKAAGTTPLAFGIKDSWILAGSVSDSIFGSFVGGEEGRQKLLRGELLPTSPEMVQSFETMNRFMQYAPENYTGVGYLDNVQLFAMGDAAIYPGGSFDLGFIESQDPEFEIGVFAPPVLKAGDTRWASMNGGAGIGLNKTSQHKKEALIYMNWLLGDKAQNMIGNMAPGLFPCANVDVTKFTDPLIGEMIDFGGKNGELYTMSWGMQLNSGTPTCTATCEENLSLMLQGLQTPAETAQKIQDAVASWYTPWQNK